MADYNLKRGAFHTDFIPAYNQIGSAFFSEENLNQVLDRINNILNSKYKSVIGKSVLVTKEYILPTAEAIYTKHYRSLNVMNKDLINTIVSKIDTSIERHRQNIHYSELLPYDGSRGITDHQVTRVLPKARFYMHFNY